MNEKGKLLTNAVLNLDFVIAGVSLVILVIITSVGTVFRYFLNAPFVWQEEVQLMCFTWIVFLGGAAVFRTSNHIMVEIVVDLFPKKVQKVLTYTNYIISMLILAYLVIYGAKLVEQLLNTYRITSVLHVPYYLIYSVMPIGCALMMVNYTLALFLPKFVNRVEDEEENEEVQG